MVHKRVLFVFLRGTGSCPHPPHGLHRKMRRAA
jgi:hypothetical protein